MLLKELKIWISRYFKKKKIKIVLITDKCDYFFKDAKTYNLIGDSNFEDALHSKVLEHSHLAVDVDIVDKLVSVK